MPAGKTPPRPTLSTLATLLGLPDERALASLTIETLKRQPQRQLVELATKLELSGTAKATKEALAVRILDAVAARRREPPGKTPEKTTKAITPPAVTSPVAASQPKASRAKASRPNTVAPKPVLAKPAISPRAADETNARLAVEEAGRSVAMRKFSLGEPAASPTEVPHHIPWSYDHDRITAMAVDPDRLFCYWDLTDAAIERARPALGEAGASAWLNLRVYDTSGRIFDGTNAHSYFDHRLDRHDRQWFFTTNKPASGAVIEIGLLSSEGYFVKIARSGRIEFPRSQPVHWSTPEWLSVRPVTGEQEHAGWGMPAHGTSGGEAGHEAPSFEPVPLWQLRAAWEEILRLAGSEARDRVEWEEISQQDDGTEIVRRVIWQSPELVSSWEAGPFTYPVEFPEVTTESSQGAVQVFRSEGRTHIVHGPWQVVIRGLGAFVSRQTLAHWEIYRSWVAEEGHEVRGLRTTHGPLGASELVAMGSSERRWQGASELRMRGASELFYVGASERLLRGASESLFMGATRFRIRGASERRLGGASERRLGGASEYRLGGGSELRLGGASEQPTPPGEASEYEYPSVKRRAK